MHEPMTHNQDPSMCKVHMSLWFDPHSPQTYLCRACKCKDIAVPLLLLCSPHALQCQRLGHCLTRTPHAA
jgi:hypothetical protein